MKPDIKIIIGQRLVRQQIVESLFNQPAELVEYMGAIQSQDYAMAKWAIGLRVPGSTDHDVEALFNKGMILRTHVLRPTWHFVSPQHIRWMLSLTAARVNASNAYMYQKMELDASVFKRCHKILSKALENNNYLDRNKIAHLFQRGKIEANGIRLACILMEAELAGLICSGPRKGKQFTYALLEERVKAVKAISREEALGRLVEIYFSTRGPATFRDFSWWSGLTIEDGKQGLQMSKHLYEMEKIDGKEYILCPYAEEPLPPLPTLKKTKSQATFLMPDFDEYGISYKDRSAIYGSIHLPLIQAEITARKHMVVVSGVIGAAWSQTMKNNRRDIAITPYKPFTKKEEVQLHLAIKKYCGFFDFQAAI